jgi:hypothetical protein
MKKKPGLAILFSCAALGLTLGSAGILAQIPSTGDTEAILRKPGVSRLDAETLAGGRQIVVYYDSHNAAGQAYSYHSKTSCSVSWSPKGETLKSGFDEEDAQAIPLKYDPAIARSHSRFSGKGHSAWPSDRGQAVAERSRDFPRSLGWSASSVFLAPSSVEPPRRHFSLLSRAKVGITVAGFCTIVSVSACGNPHPLPPRSPRNRICGQLIVT